MLSVMLMVLGSRETEEGRRRYWYQHKDRAGYGNHNGLIFVLRRIFRLSVVRGAGAKKKTSIARDHNHDDDEDEPKKTTSSGDAFVSACAATTPM